MVAIPTNREEGNDYAKIMEMISGGEIPSIGVIDVAVLHDDWCAVMNGGSVCNCDPDIHVQKVDEPQ
jgi:hypothetical protein